MTGQMSSSVDGFRLAYDRVGSGAPVILLHGWPGDRQDYRELIPRLSAEAELIAPDLRGFGDSDRHAVDPAEQYSASAQARSVAGLIEEHSLERPVIVGYDVGSRVAQALARDRPDLVGGLVLSPPLPGVGRRILEPNSQREFWYQPFHQLPLVEHVLDGRPVAVRAYLEHFWSHWSAPAYVPDSGQLDRLAGNYGRSGAFVASINYYRAGAGTVAQSLAETTPSPAERIGVPTIVVWPGADALMPLAWSDQLEAFFAQVDLRIAPDAGHFTPLEAPGELAAAVRDAVRDLQG